MEDPRELFLKTLLPGDKVRIVPILGTPSVAPIRIIDNFYIHVGNRRFDRHSGWDKQFTRIGQPFDNSAYIEPIEPV